MRYKKDFNRLTTSICISNALYKSIIVWSDSIFANFTIPHSNNISMNERVGAILWLLNTTCEDILEGYNPRED